jgi:hypothetical protein
LTGSVPFGERRLQLRWEWSLRGQVDAKSSCRQQAMSSRLLKNVR